MKAIEAMGTYVAPSVRDAQQASVLQLAGGGSMGHPVDETGLDTLFS